MKQIFAALLISGPTQKDRGGVRAPWHTDLLKQGDDCSERSCFIVPLYNHNTWVSQLYVLIALSKKCDSVILQNKYCMNLQVHSIFKQKPVFTPLWGRSTWLNYLWLWEAQPRTGPKGGPGGPLFSFIPDSSSLLLPHSASGTVISVAAAWRKPNPQQPLLVL